MHGENANKKAGNGVLENQFELTVEGGLENLAKIGLFIDRIMRHNCINDLKTIYAVQLSVDEACTNIIKHGYPQESKGKIIISCILKEQKFVVNITDFGIPFDPTNMPKPDTKSTLNDRKEGGLGIYFMREYMDEVSYVSFNGRNLLTIAKHIKNNN